MKCPEIFDLHFSPKGREAINDIADIKELGNLLATVLGVSVVLSLFVNRGTGNKRVDTGMTMHSINAYDWNVWAQAMASVGTIKKNEIKKIAQGMMLVKTSRSEYIFWEAVDNGCGR